MSEPAPVIGIVGSAGAYGRWLRGFFQQRMGLQVIGHDPADPASASPAQVIAQARVIIFSVPIRHTAQIIGQWIALADGREAGQLWLDITSVKQAPVQALLASRAEVAGLHPMCAPPKSPTLNGAGAGGLCRAPGALAAVAGWPVYGAAGAVRAGHARAP